MLSYTVNRDLLGSSVQRSAARVSRVRPFTGRLTIYAKESRIGRNPVIVPPKVEVSVKGLHVAVKGPLGKLEREFPNFVTIELKDGAVKVSKKDETRLSMQHHGLTRSLVNNMVVGVSSGFSKKLELVGTGYRAALNGNELVLNLGYSKPRVLPLPPGIKVTVEKSTSLTISGIDKVAVGDFCATVRFQRPPEPYKGKGVRYEGEIIKLKEGKGAGGKKK